MRLWHVLASLFALMLSTSNLFAHEPGSPWKIMAFGDSISGGCYPAKLWQRLTQAEAGTFQFVGYRAANKCGVDGFSGQHESHPGYVVTDLLKPAGSGTRKAGDAFGDSRDLELFFGTVVPDIVLWHIGSTNAFSPHPAVSPVLQAYSVMLAELRKKNPHVIVLVAKLLPLAKGNVNPINAAIPKWVAQNTREKSPVEVVDMYAGFDPEKGLRDGVHPNEIGTQWMVDKCYQALSPIILKSG